MLEALFSSKRLYFRNFKPQDAPDLFRLHNLPEVLRYVGMPIWTNLNEAIDYQISCEVNFALYGYARWGVYLVDNNEFIGLAGLLNRPEENYIDLGYRFLPEYWGKGFATESVNAILKFAYENTKIDLITGFADEDNEASKKVLQKCGLRYVGIGSCLGMPACQFEISKEEYYAKPLT